MLIIITVVACIVGVAVLNMLSLVSEIHARYMMITEREALAIDHAETEAALWGEKP